MHIHYNTRRDGLLIPNYVCVGRGSLFGDPPCQSILGTEIDAAVGKLLVDAVTPMALELALAVQQEIQSRLDEADRLRHRQVERAQYEADHARHRYMQVDPANRLVADSLEADWNARLRALAEAQEEYQHQRNSDRVTVDEEERKRILALAVDFPAVWADQNTPQRERKRMLALLVEDITLIKQRQVTAHVRFRGGTTTTLTLPRPLTAQQMRATHANVREQIDALLDEYTDAQVANILNERGLRTGAGDAFDPVSVQWVRFSHKLKSLKERLLAAGWLTKKQIADRLGVNRTTLSRWRLEGRLKGRICNSRGEWLYWPPAQLPPEVKASDGNVDVSLVSSRNDLGEDIGRQMNALLDEHTDGEVANILNERGLRTGAGEPFDLVGVQWVRLSLKLKSLKERLLAASWLTTKQITARLGVNRSTVEDWRANGRIKARICNDRGHWLYWPPAQLSPEVKAPEVDIAPRNDGNSHVGDAI